MLIKCVFPDEMIRQPVIYELGTKFSIVTSITKAEITPELGWVIVEITGDLQEIARGIEWLKTSGVKIEFIEEEE